MRDDAGGTARAGTDSAMQASGPLMLGLAEDADPIAAGGMLEYTVRYGNRGSGSQSSVQLVVTLPPGLTAGATNGGVVAGDTITWALGDVAGNSVGERRLEAQVVDQGAGDPHVRRTHAVVTSTSASARASAVTAIEAAPLALTMTASPDPVPKNSALTFTLAVTNRGAGVADDVQLFVPVPTSMAGTSGCTLVSDGGTFPVPCLAGNDVLWSLGPIAAGAEKTVQVTFRTSGSVANGTIVPATARATDALLRAARAAASVGLAPP